MKRITFCAHFTSLMVGFAKTSNQSGRTGRLPRQRMAGPLLSGVLLAAVALASPSSRAALVTYDGFNYPTIGPFTIDGQPSNGTQASNGWDNVTWGQFFAGGAKSYVVTNGSLADPSGLLYRYSNCVYTTGGSAGRYNTTPANWATPGATYYFSILIKPANTPVTTNYYGLLFLSNGGNTGDGHNLFAGKNGSGLNWGLEYSTNVISGNTTNLSFVDTYSGVPATANQTAFLVVRVDFNFGTPDVFSLYVNPTPGGPEPATPDAVLTNDIGTQNGVEMLTGNGGAAFFDEIRLGATFASVTPTTSATDPNLLTWEQFAYNQGTSLGTLNGQPNDGTQGSNGWDGVTWGQFLGGANGYTIGNGSLSDPSNMLVTTGNRVQTSGGFAGRFNVYTGLPGHTNANPTYYSVLIRPDNLGATNGIAYLQIFGQPNGNDLLAGKLTGSTFWGLQSGTNLGQAFSTVQAVSNQTAFLVVRGNYVQGGPSTFLLYVNPTPGAPEPATPDASVSFNIQTQNGVAFNTQNGAAASFDEIRVGTNYADVTPAVTVVANPFVITSIQLLGGTNAVISFTTTSTNVYSVEANSDLVTGTWTTVASGIPGTGGIVQSTNAVPPGALKRFYRARHP
ncbi:MAG TPA: hypothetical protein VNL17_13075 [Verrucomicrobiae bacterium]|nr:hypothetical protein [Verrucomicrobiae bacterium]